MEKTIDEYIDEQINKSFQEIMYCMNYFHDQTDPKHIYNTIRECVMNILVYNTMDRKDDD
jgi:hypothetical protein